MLARLDDVQEDYFSNGISLTNGLPSVQFIARHLNVLQWYLSDMLQSLPGYNT